MFCFEKLSFRPGIQHWERSPSHSIGGFFKQRKILCQPTSLWAILFSKVMISNEQNGHWFQDIKIQWPSRSFVMLQTCSFYIWNVWKCKSLEKIRLQNWCMFKRIRLFSTAMKVHFSCRGVYGVLLGNLRENDYLEDPGIDGRITLRWIFRKWDGLDRCGSGQGQVADTCQCGKETLGSTKYGKFLYWLRILKKDSAPSSE